MKIVAIGDIHGRRSWRKISEQPFDKLIFIGDYFDTHESISSESQIVNFKEILALKDTRPKDVILLIGNHDFHYLKVAGEHYSGYRPQAAEAIREVLYPAVKAKKLQMSYMTEDYTLFTHAGVTKTWCDKNRIDQMNIVHSINKLFKTNPSAFRFFPGDTSGCGENKNQGPIWVRPDSLTDDAIDVYKQVVGHTGMRTALRLTKLTFIDCLGTSGEYYVKEI